MADGTAAETREADSPDSYVDAEALQHERGGNDLGVDDTIETESGHETLEEDALLATDRIGLEALEDLFTDRTDDAEEEEPEDDLPTTRTDEDAAADGEQLADYDETDSDTNLTAGDGSPRTGSAEFQLRGKPCAPSISRAASPPVATPSAQRSPSRPTIPARPPRSGISTPNTLGQQVSYHNTNSTTQSYASAPAPLQLVSFDVGGRLFRCKAALVRKFPEKRLCHVMSCGCEQIDHDTYFIDRNPQHFELILDWYRTGKPLRSLPSHVNEDALKEDAKYFDLYDELFPKTGIQAAPPIPSRTTSPSTNSSTATTTALPKLPERPSRQPTPASTPVVTALPTEPLKPKANKQRTPSGVCRFTKSETQSVPTIDGGIPVWFAVRSHEHLVVESVKGSGKLCVRVSDPTGMARVFVDQAVLFDSRSWFYLQEDGRAKLQHCVLPGNHVYTFWTEPIHEQPPSPPPPTLKTKPVDKSRAKAAFSTAVVVPRPPAKPDLEVVFKLIAAFSPSEEMEENAELASLLQAKGKGWSDDPAAAAAQPPTGDGGVSVCLFLPPRNELVVKETEKLIEDTASLQERDAIAEQIRAIAAKDRNQKAIVGLSQPGVPQQDNVTKSGGNALKRNGAAIAQPQQHKNTANRLGEKVTVHQSVETLLASPPSPRGHPGQYNSQQPRRF